LIAKLVVVLSTALFCFLAHATSSPKEEEIKIAVYFTEDPAFFINIFAPTIDHLREQYPQYRFITKEISGNEPVENLKKENFSFLISPASFYASFDPSSEGLRQIATRFSSQAKNASESVGAAIITLRERKDIQSISDLKDKRIVTRDISSLSGWLSAKGEIIQYLKPEEFESHLINTQYSLPDVYDYLLSGEADVAIVPSCELESLNASSNLNTSLFKVIGEKRNSLACKVSTDLYPDYVFSSFPSADPDIVKKVTISLLTMPKLPDQATWGIAHDFRSVLQLYKKLEIGPYKPKEFSLANFFNKYKTEVLLAIALLFGVLFHIYRVNSLVLQRTSELRKAIEQRDKVAEIARTSLRRLSQMEKRGILSQLSNIFVHELKQPLSTVVNYANGLKIYSEQKELDPILQESIEAIASESSKASQIVDRVREYAKAPHPISSAGRTDLIVSVKKAIDAFRLYVSTNCHLTTEFPETAFIKGDPLELEILTLNLLKNASDAVEVLKDKATITVRVRKSEDNWLLIISDNGPKVSKDVLERMKGALQASLKPDGLGLGLMIVFAITERHKAHLEFHQLEPQGLEIQISFKEFQP